MSEFRDRLVRAALEYLGGCPDFGGVPVVWIDGSVDAGGLVDVLLVEMREPTAGMVERASRGAKPWEDFDPADGWRAMIDEATKEAGYGKG